MTNSAGACVLKEVVRAAQATVDESYQLEEQTVRLHLQHIYDSVLARQRILNICETAVVPPAEARRAMAEVGWKAGKLDFMFVVQSLRDAAEAKRQRLQALGDLWHATLELHRAQGDL